MIQAREDSTLTTGSCIIDIGGSYKQNPGFPALTEGYENISVIDISEQAIEPGKATPRREGSQNDWIVQAISSS
ncbi:MAG: hypothetical protein IPH04_04250 [Saprospirales bacterium]|nr:hypothetical protein [Saprospirales bacterium]